MQFCKTLILLLQLTFHLAFGQTHISYDQTWQGDTIFVDQNVMIDAGAKLTIAPGTVVYFSKRKLIDVYGELLVSGAEGDSVIMTGPDTTGWIDDSGFKRFYGWGGIHVHNTGVFHAKFTAFERLGYSGNVSDGYVVDGVIENKSSKPMVLEHSTFRFKHDVNHSGSDAEIRANHAAIEISDCLFKNNRGRGTFINCNSGTLTLSNTTFSNNDLWGYMINASSSTYTIRSCTFAGNKTRAIVNAITFNETSSIESNTFENNIGAMQLQGVYSSIYFRNNIYRNNGGQIFFWLGNNVITGNIFQSNYYSDPYDFFGNDYPAIVRIGNSELSGPVVVNNTLINNVAMALRLEQVNNFKIQNNIFHKNYPSDCSLELDSEYLNTGGSIFTHNLINPLASGEGNSISHPRLNGTGEQFTLAANSPAINTGSPLYSSYLLDIDAIGNPRNVGQIDIGATEFQHEYIPLTDVNISTSVIGHVGIGDAVGQFSTMNQFSTEAIHYSLAAENGMNNDYFSITGNELRMARELTTETLLRIKVRVEHVSGGWLEEYYYLNVAPLVVGIEEDANSTVNIFPVPTDRFLQVENSIPGTRYTIFTSSGTMKRGGILITDTIDLAGLPEGLYVLRLTHEHSSVTKRFSKIAP